MRMNRSLLLIPLLITVTGCQFANQSELKQLSVESNPSSFNAIAVTSPNTSLSMTVRHMISDENVFVECYVPGFDFSEDQSKSDGEKAGHLLVSVDHQKPYPVYKAAFIVKNLTKGTHYIKMTLVNQKGESFKGMSKQLLVQIP